MKNTDNNEFRDMTPCHNEVSQLGKDNQGMAPAHTEHMKSQNYS